MSDPKLNVLADLVADKTFDRLNDKLTKIQVTIASLVTRLDLLSVATTPAVAGKRDVRTPAGAAKKAAAGGGAAAPLAKMTNRLAYLKKAMSDDLDGVREEFGTDEAVEQAKSSADAAKIKGEEGTPEWWGSIAGVIWKNMEEDQKTVVKHRMDSYNRAIDSAGAAAALEEDDN